MQTQPGPAVPQCSIAVPGDWIVANLDFVRDPATIANAIDDHIESDELDADVRDEAIEIVTRMMSATEEQGVLFAAVRVASDGSGSVLASVVLSAAVVQPPIDAQEPGEPIDDDVETVPLSQPLDADSGGTDGAPGQLSVRSEPIQLPAGPAMRIERILGREVGERAEQEVYVVQYVLPTNADGLSLTMTGISPAVRRKDDLDAAFAEIAGTIVVTR